MNQKRVNEIVDMVSKKYSEDFINMFWEWANFPENASKKERLAGAKDVVDFILDLSWCVVSSSRGMDLLDKQREKILRIMRTESDKDLI